MQKIKILPKNFNYIFSQKELKGIESENNIKFAGISSSYTSSTAIQNDSAIEVKLATMHIQARFEENVWHFYLSLNGFRNELLSEGNEIKVKTEIKNKIKSFIAKISGSKETDLYNNPTLWNYVIIHHNLIKFEWVELNPHFHI